MIKLVVYLENENNNIEFVNADSKVCQYVIDDNKLIVWVECHDELLSEINVKLIDVYINNQQYSLYSYDYGSVGLFGYFSESYVPEHSIYYKLPEMK